MRSTLRVRTAAHCHVPGPQRSSTDLLTLSSIAHLPSHQEQASGGPPLLQWRQGGAAPLLSSPSLVSAAAAADALLVAAPGQPKPAVTQGNIAAVTGAGADATPAVMRPGAQAYGRGR